MRTCKWTHDQFVDAARHARSFRQLIARLGLKPAGGNYAHIRAYAVSHAVDISHFTGRGWSKGVKLGFIPKQELNTILVQGSTYQSHKLKNRLFRAGLKPMHCEICKWAQKSLDGYLPLELDHINGDHHDNRLENLRILCPNCHSLQPTHRGRNIRNRKRTA